MNERFILPRLAAGILEGRFFGDPRCPFEGKLKEGDPRLLVIAGENASGKSLFFRILAAAAQQDEDTLGITISIRERVGSGTSGIEGMRRAFMFGDEHDRSTGANSASVVERGFANVDRDRPVILMLDEPEIGLSPSYRPALGRFIGEQARNLPTSCRGVVVVTHDRSLGAGLAEGLAGEDNPSIVVMGGGPESYSAWLSDVRERSVEELLALKDLGLERFRATQKLLDEINGRTRQ